MYITGFLHLIIIQSIIVLVWIAPVNYSVPNLPRSPNRPNRPKVFQVHSQWRQYWCLLLHSAWSYCWFCNWSSEVIDSVL